MNWLVVESPGLLTTVQDLGRPGFGAVGVSESGAADTVSLRLGNLLLGNEPGAAALEMTLTGGTFLFPEGAVIALSGAEFGAQCEGMELSLHCVYEIARGGRVTLGATQNSARGYLCVAGGIAAPEFLGSASTHLLSGLGGWEGRALRKGDRLPLGSSVGQIRRRVLSSGAAEAVRPKKTLRVTSGPQVDWFEPEVWEKVFGHEFVVTEESNRMGLRLDGPRLQARGGGEMISEGVSLGAVQVTPAGQAIILFVEQQTTGGYPKIANVISADMHHVGQLRPRDRIRFAELSLEAAREAWLKQERLLSDTKRLFA